MRMLRGCYEDATRIVMNKEKAKERERGGGGTKNKKIWEGKKLGTEKIETKHFWRKIKALI